MGNGLQKSFPRDDQSPGRSLHWALSNRFNKLVRLQLRRGADPNAPDKEGLTPLHVICRRNYNFDVLKHFFDVCDELNQRVRVNARDKSGKTPLHYAVTHSYKQKVVELLLRRGAEPNAADHRGMRPLHVARDSEVAKMFLDACIDAGRTVQVDARDKLGRTPLQWAVADLKPRMVRLLVDYGADLSNFDFPTSDYFAKKWRLRLKYVCENIKMLLTCNFLVVYQILAVRGYETDLMTDVMILKFFDDHGLFVKKSAASGDKLWYDNEEFVREAKKTRLNSSLLFYDLVRLGPAEAAELVSYEDHFKIMTAWGSFTRWTCLSDEFKEAGDAHLCETIMRSHHRVRGIRPFMDEIRCELHWLMNENYIFISWMAASSILDRRHESLLVDFSIEMFAVIVCISLVYIFSLYNIEVIKLYK